MSIWKFNSYLKPTVTESFRLSLDEGNTPCISCDKLAKKLSLEKIYLKREDKNPSGSFKDRSLAFQLSVYKQKGINEFVISSSGNSAISTIAFAKKYNLRLHVFVSDTLPHEKLKRLLNEAKIQNFDALTRTELKMVTIHKKNISITFSPHAQSNSLQFARQNKLIHLRGSSDNLACVGFKTIVFELASQAPDTDALFIPTSSGTGTTGIYSGFVDLGLRPIPQIHIVQTTKVHTIAQEFDKNFIKTKTSIATAIVDRIAKRKEQILEIIRKTRGSGWIISDKEIIHAQELLNDVRFMNISPDSALSLAGLIKAISKKFKVKRPVLILSGK
jgi:threonine synthase